MSKELLEKQAELLANNISGWESRTLERIGKRIKATGRLSAYDRKALDNMANIGVDLEEIYKDLAKVTALNIAEVQKMYETEMTEQVKRSQALYKAKGVPFIPYEGNAFAQQLVKNWARQTSGEMINLSRTKALKLGWFDETSNATNFLSIDEVYLKTIDKAVVAIRTGTSDFYNEMRQVIETIGQHGAVQYESGVVRHIDNVIRQNILYGAKQSAQQYQEYIGKQFGADGFEVDYHPHPRPSHEFMGGKMFSYNGRVKINGIVYEDGKEALARLQDYNCLHFKTDVLLGISEPTWDSAELEHRKAEDKKLIDYEVNGKTLSKTKYEWSQKQRELERMAREEKRQADFNKSCGNNIKAKEHNKSYRQIRNAYDDLCDKVGLTPTPERMATYTSAKLPKTSTPKMSTPKPKIVPTEIENTLSASGIEYNAVKTLSKPIKQEKIIEKLSGGDMTQGSCSSLGFAYMGNKNGLDVIDFRGGKSCDFFSRKGNIRKIAQIDGIDSKIVKVKSEIKGTVDLIKDIDYNKEYYLAVGKHASIIRRREEVGFEYLELQSAKNSGWHKLTTSELQHRFGATKSQRTFMGMKLESEVILIDVDSAKGNEAFKNILGYINTAENKQMKGVMGSVK